MIIVPIKEGENIEKSLKKFKRKFEKTGIVRELRSKKTFEKPSVKRRTEIKNNTGYPAYACCRNGRRYFTGIFL